MKKLTLSVFLTLNLLCLIAQQSASDTLTIGIDTIEQVKKQILPFESGIFLELGSEISPIYTDYRPMLAYGVGAQYKFFFAGFNIHHFQGKITSLLVFPNSFLLRYKYGAIYIGTRLMALKKLELDMRISYGLGDVVWERESNHEHFLRDKFSVFQPELITLYRPLETINIFAKLGFKQINDLNLARLNNHDLSGFIFGIGLRCGIYQP